MVFVICVHFKSSNTNLVIYTICRNGHFGKNSVFHVHVFLFDNCCYHRRKGFLQKQLHLCSKQLVKRYQQSRLMILKRMQQRRVMKAMGTFLVLFKIVKFSKTFFNCSKVFFKEVFKKVYL